MSKSGSNQKGGNSNVIDLASKLCCAEGCKKRTDVAEFCTEHFAWYKEGLINKKGVRPKDFDKKHQAFLQRKPVAA